MNIPDKCINCNHSIAKIENVHKGWMKYQLETVLRCDCSPTHSVVGCVVAEMTCAKNREEFYGRQKQKSKSDGRAE